MRSRVCGLSLILVPAALWASLAAAAAKAPPDVEPLPAASPSAVLLAPAGSMDASCVLGETRPGVYSVNYLLPPDDAYYTLLRRSECTACPDPSGVYLGTAHVRLYFPTACTQKVAVSIVVGDGDPCPVPNPAAVYCPPVEYDLTPPSTGVFDFALPLPAGCGILGTAFLCINFVEPGNGCSTVTTVPRLVTTDNCVACRSYNIYRGGTDELCSLAFPGNPVMSVDVDACTPPFDAVGPRRIVGVSLSAAMPNPSRGRTTLRLALETPARVRARVCDVAGRIVRVLADEPLAAGLHVLQWDGRDQSAAVVAPGIYFCRVVAGRAEFTRTIVVTR
jgi:hypothetical protein